MKAKTNNIPIISNDGISLNITYEKLFEILLSLNDEKRAELICKLMDYGDVESIVVQQLYNHCSESAKQFEEMHNDPTFVRILGKDNGYGKTAKRYQEEAEAWKNLMNCENIKNHF